MKDSVQGDSSPDFGVSRSNIMGPAIYFTSAWKFATVVGLTELMAH